MKRLGRGKAARERFVASTLDKNLATQIRAIRDRQGLSQERLAELAGGMNQNAISRLESPTYGKPTITTLKRLAAAFDVGLVVRFVPGHSTEAFAVPNFDEELAASIAASIRPPQQLNAPAEPVQILPIQSVPLYMFHVGYHNDWMASRTNTGRANTYEYVNTGLLSPPVPGIQEWLSLINIHQKTTGGRPNA
jgi:transcriptional regulator with XRE-family HTH domain